MSTNRRKFLIGSVGLGTSLVAGQAVATQYPGMKEGQAFERYVRFLNYEYAQAMRLMSVDSAIAANPRTDPNLIRQTMMNKPLREQALYWFPDDCPDIVQLCTSGRITPMDRAGAVLKSIDIF